MSQLQGITERQMRHLTPLLKNFEWLLVLPSQDRTPSLSIQGHLLLGKPLFPELCSITAPHSTRSLSPASSGLLLPECAFHAFAHAVCPPGGPSVSHLCLLESSLSLSWKETVISAKTAPHWSLS